MTNENKNYDNLKINKLGKSQIEIIASIPATFWEKNRTEALKNINESVSIDGFRKGMVPENILVSKVGERVINEEMAEIALSKVYIEIILNNKIDAIDKPEVQITKLAKGNPLEFRAVTVIMPEVKLPDYKKIAKEMMAKESNKEIKVEEKDIDEAILKIRKSRVSHDDHDHEKMSPEEHEKAIMDSLPDFNDEFVRTLGDFKTVAEFKEKVREIIGENKRDEAKEKLRIKIADEISQKSEVEIPQVMVESEIDRTQAQFNKDLERMGVKMEDYLKHSKKKIEEIRKDWEPQAEKKAKLQLILNAIASAEKIKPDQKEIDEEVGHIVAHYKDADRENAAIYAETVLTNEKVFAMLEGVK